MKTLPYFLAATCAVGLSTVAYLCWNPTTGVVQSSEQATRAPRRSSDAGSQSVEPSKVSAAAAPEVDQTIDKVASAPTTATDNPEIAPALPTQAIQALRATHPNTPLAEDESTSLSSTRLFTTTSNRFLTNASNPLKVARFDASVADNPPDQAVGHPFEIRETPVIIPLALSEADPATLQLTEKQLETIDEVADRFIKEVGGENQNPDDPDYLARWKQSQPTSDQLLKVMIGWQAYNRLQMGAAQSARQADQERALP